MGAVSRRKVISTLATGGASLALAGVLRTDAKYIDAFMQNVNWDEVNRRVEAIGSRK